MLLYLFWLCSWEPYSCFKKCSHLPLRRYLVPGQLIPHWRTTLSSIAPTRHSFFMLGSYSGLWLFDIDDLGHFHGASFSIFHLCHYVCENAHHFIAVAISTITLCSHLTSLASSPPSVSSALHDSQLFCDVTSSCVPDFSILVFPCNRFSSFLGTVFISISDFSMFYIFSNE